MFKIDGDKYHVYYVGNGEVGIVSSKDLSPDKWKVKRRGDFVGAEFYFEGESADPSKGLPALKAGRWKVRRVVDNEFVCVRLSGEGTNMENFDISYVMGEVRAEEEYVRERGPFCKGRF